MLTYEDLEEIAVIVCAAIGGATIGCWIVGAVFWWWAA